MSAPIGPSVTRSHRHRCPRAKIGAIALGVSVATWMFSSAKSMGPDEFHLSVRVAAGIQIGTVVVLSSMFADRSAMIGPSMASPPLLLAGYTYPRGDEDGLWVLIFLPLIVWAGILVVLSALVALAVRTGWKWRNIPVPKWSKRSQAVVLTISMVLGALAILLRWPNPWPSLEAAQRNLEVPSEFQPIKREHSGSPLSMYAPRLSLSYRVDLHPEEACDLLAESSQVQRVDDQGFTCTFEGRLRTSGRIRESTARLVVREFDPQLDADLGLDFVRSAFTLVGVTVSPTNWPER